MNKLKLLFFWCLLLGTFVSCGDKDDDPQPASTAEQDYIPTTKGSNWTYGGVRPYSYRVTGGTKVIDGLTYVELETTAGSETAKSYLIKDKGVYTTIGFVPNSGDIKIAILKEETPVGKPWEQKNVINGVETKMTFTIVEKDVTKTVEGKTYKNVINVKMVTTYTFMGVDFDTAITTNYYFAKGVGLILTDVESYGQIPLLSYTVK
jgi:hypothetical protein